MTKPRGVTRSPLFEPGAKVRVKRGVTDPDFPDIPLGGWAGTIEAIEQAEGQTVYEIEWDGSTVHGMHPVYRKRCDRDGLDPARMWLDEQDIEADVGPPVPIEQPTEIVTRPLSMKDQGDRIRAVFGLTHDDPLPEVSHEALRTYHRYLVARLRFPFSAAYGEEEIGPYSRKRATLAVTGLADPEVERLDDEYGLIGKGHDQGRVIRVPLDEIEVKKKDPNAKLVADYACWFQHCGGGRMGRWERALWDHDGPSPQPLASRWRFVKAVTVVGMAGGVLGATIGAALSAIKHAGPAALIGGVPSGALGAWLLGRYGFFFGAMNRIRHGSLFGAILGLLVGGLLGVLVGLTIPALPWSLAGGIVGVIAGRTLVAEGWRSLGAVLGAIVGTCGGILVLAFRRDQAEATDGCLSGGILGVIVGSVLLAALAGSLHLLPRRAGVSHEHNEEKTTSRQGGTQE